MSLDKKTCTFWLKNRNKLSHAKLHLILIDNSKKKFIHKFQLMWITVKNRLKTLL